MTGLLLKDIRLLKNQKNYIVLFIVISALFLFMGEGMSFITGYLAAVFSILTINTIGYDESDNGYSFLFTLPVSRREYVLEKYILGGIIILFLLAAGAVLGIVAPVIKPEVYRDTEPAVIIISVLVVSVLVQSLAVPLQLKFGAEKSRIAMGMLVACGIIAASVIREALSGLEADVSSMLTWMDRAEPALLILCMCAAVFVIFAVSCLVSVIIMKRKQF